MNGFLTAGDLIAFIGDATSQLRAAGYNGVVSTADTVGTFLSFPSICNALEGPVHVNIHPYFDYACSSSHAGSFVAGQKHLVENACNGKTVIVSETGWPSDGDGGNRATSVDQAVAISSIHDSTPGDITFFSYSDDYWKSAGIEQHFGIST